ncbi:pyrroline-5-carboxylate reductase [Bacilliculturomica massiliensis]|uniref:pyrroline-5-carboxylate reductase n=1 Tax=Bacilliculturomica massiliensis TaxID=1917867 RepID=UPI0013EEEF6B|nr:pyrroline-5-carboxylate reductase [Bacilliculturomica massiliensis]
MNRRIVFVGGGNMAEGIIGGLLDQKVFAPEEIAVDDIIPERLSYLNATYGIVPEDVGTYLKDADMIVLAVRPQDIDSATEKVKESGNKTAVILSICAGVTLGKLETELGAERKILKVMPNTQIKVHSGYSAACVNSNITEEDKEFISAFLGALGQSMYLDEKMYDTFTAYSCTGPFYIYKFAEALIDAGVRSGFSRKDARNIVIRNLMGVASTMELTGAHPAVLCDSMTSPGGVTIEAQQSLCKNGFAGIVMTAVDEAVRKANSLG